MILRISESFKHVCFPKMFCSQEEVGRDRIPASESSWHPGCEGCGN